MSLLENFAPKRPPNIDVATLGRDAMAGTISAIVNIAYCISFSALIFQGSIAAGFPLGLAALIMGTMVTGVVVALTTTLVPADAGPDTPAVAVMSVLATTVAAGLAAKGADTDTMIINVMVAITVSTFLTGAVLFGLGGLKLGQWLRFVPFPVIGGFLAASGFLLITGGVEVITGSNLTLSPSSWAIVADMHYAPQIAVGLAFALFIVLLKRWMDDYLTLPIAFFIFLVVLNVILLWFVKDPETQANWYLAAVGALQLWWPIEAVATHDIDWGVMALSSAEIGAVCGVTAISMLLDVSSLEVARQKSADLDKEFRTNGFANVLASVLGGVAGNLSLNNSLLSAAGWRGYAHQRRFGGDRLWFGPLRWRRYRQFRTQGDSRRDAGLSRYDDIDRGSSAFAGAAIPNRSRTRHRNCARHSLFRVFGGRGSGRCRCVPAFRAVVQPDWRDPASPDPL